MPIQGNQFSASCIMLHYGVIDPKSLGIWIHQVGVNLQFGRMDGLRSSGSHWLGTMFLEARFEQPKPR